MPDSPPFRWFHSVGITILRPAPAFGIEIVRPPDMSDQEWAAFVAEVKAELEQEASDA